jgi:hypothetical protein
MIILVILLPISFIILYFLKKLIYSRIGFHILRLNLSLLIDNFDELSLHNPCLINREVMHKHHKV